jgi:predicted metal-dependent phosphoesterase TrpH
VWRQSVAQARARVERARRSYQTLAGLNLVPGYEYQDAKGRTVIHSVDELQRMTAEAKAELDAAEKALADLLERARRAGVPPGWLR